MKSLIVMILIFAMPFEYIFIAWITDWIIDKIEWRINHKKIKPNPSNNSDWENGIPF